MEACGFKRTRYGSVMTISYPTGHIGLLIAEKEPAMSADYASIHRRYREMIGNGKKTTYYHPSLQKGYVNCLLVQECLQTCRVLTDDSILSFFCCRFCRCFDLPLWAHENIYGSEDTSDLLCDNERPTYVKDS